MMLLPIQIQAILYHLLMGWVYGLGFSFILTLNRHFRIRFFKGIMEILYHILFTLLMYYGLFCINGGITNIYLIVFFLLGMILYYRYYLAVFLSFFQKIIAIFRWIRKKFKVVKYKILGIIKVLIRRVNRRKGYDKKRKRTKAKRKQKEKTSD